MTKRKPMTKARRVRVFDAASGRCHLCGLAIKTGERWEAEHVIALECGGTDDDANLRPAHVECHKGKTATDAAIGAKLTRMRARHIGAHATKARIASPPKRIREPRYQIPMPPRRPLWITLNNPKGAD